MARGRCYITVLLSIPARHSGSSKRTVYTDCRPESSPTTCAGNYNSDESISTVQTCQNEASAPDPLSVASDMVREQGKGAE